MTRSLPEIIIFLDEEVSKMIAEKYGYSLEKALRRFLLSKTHALLEDEECGLWALSANAVFNIWECECVTGDPRTSVYIRAD